MKKTVLIVEDNDLNMKLFHDLLEAHGYITLQTKDGRQAVLKPLFELPFPEANGVGDVAGPPREIGGLPCSVEKEPCLTFRFLMAEGEDFPPIHFTRIAPIPYSLSNAGR